MGIYSYISKQIGWNGIASIPSVKEAEELKTLVEAGNIEAFRKVFCIHRFAPTPSYNDEEGIKALSIIYNAHKVGSTNPDWR